MSMTGGAIFPSESVSTPNQRFRPDSVCAKSKAWTLTVTDSYFERGKLQMKDELDLFWDAKDTLAQDFVRFHDSAGLSLSYAVVSALSFFQFLALTFVVMCELLKEWLQRAQKTQTTAKKEPPAEPSGITRQFQEQKESAGKPWHAPAGKA